MVYRQLSLENSPECKELIRAQPHILLRQHCSTAIQVLAKSKQVIGLLCVKIQWTYDTVIRTCKNLSDQGQNVLRTSLISTAFLSGMQSVIIEWLSMMRICKKLGPLCRHSIDLTKPQAFNSWVGSWQEVFGSVCPGSLLAIFQTTLEDKPMVSVVLPCHLQSHLPPLVSLFKLGCMVSLPSTVLKPIRLLQTPGKTMMHSLKREDEPAGQIFFPRDITARAGRQKAGERL